VNLLFDYGCTLSSWQSHADAATANEQFGQGNDYRK